MANPKQNRPGKVISQVKGLRIRLTPQGEFGIYAGKHLYKSYLTCTGAEKQARKITSDQPIYYSLIKDFKEWKTKRK